MQVDETLDYCNGDSPAIQLAYMLGCYHGDMSRTVVESGDGSNLPADCAEVDVEQFTGAALRAALTVAQLPPVY